MAMYRYERKHYDLSHMVEALARISESHLFEVEEYRKNFRRNRMYVTLACDAQRLEEVRVECWDWQRELGKISDLVRTRDREVRAIGGERRMSNYTGKMGEGMMGDCKVRRGWFAPGLVGDECWSSGWERRKELEGCAMVWKWTVLVTQN
jgi:hypothetical protein